ncbi:tachykinin-like peptides receptor 86C isoform X2 [Zootermopsis nevadensis]|uniref:tachykinin-like peptides receptor 86C isoform X2 n=1 Tax=Zootermopsis nevadensis TaxID=136037 RepID=UPI000B8E7183|nr:tachykinin-like peptides receptor 86C isoform X2 [Zootermopsis nevadensis]
MFIHDLLYVLTTPSTTPSAGCGKMWNITNYLVLNMCIAHIPLTLFNSSSRFLYLFNSDWYIGKWYCHFNNFLANMSVAVTAMTISAISVERYLAIVWSYTPKMSMKIIVMIILIWVAGFAIGLPSADYDNTIARRDTGNTRTVCVLKWPNGDIFNSTLDHGYDKFLLQVTYIWPMFIMGMCYSTTAMELWCCSSNPERAPQEIHTRHTKKEATMFISMMVVFAVCTLPFHVHNIYAEYDLANQYGGLSKHLDLAANWLAGANAMINPLLFILMNSRFRQCLIDAWRQCHCPFWKRSVHLEDTELTMFHMCIFRPESTSAMQVAVARPTTQSLNAQIQY